jgi:hypothetical protein
MVKFWRRSTTLERVLLVVVLLCLFGLLGTLIWDYPTWPLTVVAALAAVINLISRGRGRSNPQENDPRQR